MATVITVSQFLPKSHVRTLTAALQLVTQHDEANGLLLGYYSFFVPTLQLPVGDATAKAMLNYTKRCHPHPSAGSHIQQVHCMRYSSTVPQLAVLS